MRSVQTKTTKPKTFTDGARLWAPLPEQEKSHSQNNPSDLLDRGCISRRRKASREVRKVREVLKKQGEPGCVSHRNNIEANEKISECESAALAFVLDGLPSRSGIFFLYQATLDGLSDSINNKSESSAYASLSHSKKSYSPLYSLL